MRVTLSRHVVSSVTTAEIGSQYLRPVGRNSFRGHHGSGEASTVYVVETDRGATGWGLPLYGGDPARLIGRNLADLIDPDRGVIDPAAEFLDYPLHDLAARILDVPVYVMLGAAGSPRIRCYSGGIYFDDLDPEARPPARRRSGRTWRRITSSGSATSSSSSAAATDGWTRRPASSATSR